MRESPMKERAAPRDAAPIARRTALGRRRSILLVGVWIGLELAQAAGVVAAGITG
jgi:hypothetical protein